MGRWKYASNVFIFVASVTFLFMFEKSYWLALKKRQKLLNKQRVCTGSQTWACDNVQIETKIKNRNRS